MTAGHASSGVPGITVAVPTLDRPEMLRRAVRSVLSQSYQELEVIISDNASSVDMSPLAPEFDDPRVRFQRHEARLSMAQNWNSCLDVAQGEYFLLLSDDDVLLPEALVGLAAGFRKADGTDAAQVGFCYGRALVVDSHDRVLWKSFRGAGDEAALAFYRGSLRHRRQAYPCGQLFRTEDLRAAGGYDGERFGVAADLGAGMSTALARGRVRSVDRFVCRYTEHAANLSGQIDLAEWPRMLREIEAMVVSRAGLPQREREVLDTAANDFIAYYVMDLVGKRALASGSGALRAWRSADQARKDAVCPATMQPRVRAMAKLLYLRAGGLARGTTARS